MVGPLLGTVQRLMLPLPAAVGSNPAGSVSVTVTVPVVGPGPVLLRSEERRVGEERWWKLPAWLLAMIKSAAAWVIVVGSLAVLLAVLSLQQPATVTVLVRRAR